MAVQKRIIWVDDADWAAIRGQAESEGKTISVLMRERTLATNGHVTVDEATRFGSPRPAPKMKAR